MSRFLDIRVRLKQPYSKENLLRAYDATKTGMSVYRAARVYGVPESTLRDRTRCNIQLDATPGPEKIFSVEEETQLVNHIAYMAEIGYGYNKSTIQYLALDFAKSVGKKTKTTGCLSNNWFYGFMKRWPDLKLVQPQKLQLSRAKSASKEVLDQYFKELKKIVTENGLTELPARILNIDETGVSTEHSPPKIVCSKSTKPQAITSPRSLNVTIIAGANAIGNSIPPFYVFPGKRWNDDLLKEAPAGSAGRMSETGWSNSDIFETYIKDHLPKFVSLKEGTDNLPLLILYDGHKSHISLTLTEWARKRNVVLFVLPPHTSHLTQPLDVGVFGPFKNHYYMECHHYLQRNPGVSITKYEIAELTARPYLKALCPDNIVSAFRKSGIFPVNRNCISDSQVAPAVIYNTEKDMADRSTPLPDKPASSSTIASVTETTDNAFLNSKKITASVKKPCKRFVTPYKSVSGNLLDKSNSKILIEQSKKRKMSSSVKDSQSCSVTRPSKLVANLPKQVTRLDNMTSPKPSTSGIIKNKKAISVSLISPSESSESDFSDDDETCCVCNLRCPEQLRGSYHVYFVKWGKCDFCSHWTHLIHCSDVKVLRRDSVFKCPHCICEE